MSWFLESSHTQNTGLCMHVRLYVWSKLQISVNSRLNWGVFSLNVFLLIELLVSLNSLSSTGNSVTARNESKWEVWGQHASKEAWTPSWPSSESSVLSGIIWPFETESKTFSSTHRVKGILVALSGKHWNEFTGFRCWCKMVIVSLWMVDLSWELLVPLMLCQTKKAYGIAPGCLSPFRQSLKQ